MRMIHSLRQTEDKGGSLSGSAENARSRALLSFALFRCYGGCLNGEAQPSRSFIKAPAIVPFLFGHMVLLEKASFFCYNNLCIRSVRSKVIMFKSIELFAGAGGLALGLEQAGFEHIGLVEFDRSAANTLIFNRPQWKVLCEDIAITTQKDLEKEFNIQKGELDLLSGGAPCQSFSYAGKRLGLQDVRGTMFYHYATFLEKLQPKMFLFENVRGLLTHDKGKTYQTILSIFEEQGYKTMHAVLNAWDYGVPQKRERLITVGIRNDLVNKCSFIFPKKHNYRPIMRDVKLDVNPSKDECERYSEYKEKIFALIPPGGYWRDIDPEIAKEYMKTCWYMGGGRTGILRRIGLDEPSLTVLTSPGMKQTDRCHPIEVRPFSYRENARIQTFPDTWGFWGKLSEKYKQVGNAVPVNLAKEIGIAIKNTLEEINND